MYFKKRFTTLCSYLHFFTLAHIQHILLIFLKNYLLSNFSFNCQPRFCFPYEHYRLLRGSIRKLVFETPPKLVQGWVLGLCHWLGFCPKFCLFPFCLLCPPFPSCWGLNKLKPHRTEPNSLPRFFRSIFFFLFTLFCFRIVFYQFFCPRQCRR